MKHDCVDAVLQTITRPALLHDYPWASLGEGATIIDLGCATGDVGLDMLRLHPNLHWAFQDLGPVIEKTQADLTPQLTELGLLSRATFTAQDYFQPNNNINNVHTSSDAKPLVFFMRGVARDYGDADALALFRATATTMRTCPPGTKLLINEIVCPSATVVSDDDVAKKAHSECIPAATQSSLVETANAMAMSATSFLNGAERTYAQYSRLLEEAGLQVVQLHRLRTFTCIMECQVKKRA